MKPLIKYECEFCHQMFNTKEAAINHENEHKKLKDILIKEIYYDDTCCLFKIYLYNAKYQELEEAGEKYKWIKLTKHRNFHGESYYRFDEIQYEMNQYDDETNDLKMFTLNMDKNYEKECIDKIIAFKEKDLSKKLEQLNKLKSTKHIDRIESEKW